MRQYFFRIEEGEPLIRTLEKKLAEKGIGNAFIVSLVGAMKDFSLVTIRQASQKIPPEHYEAFFDRKCEICGSGVIKEGKPHIHVVCGQDGGQALAGHLVEGTVTYFAEVGVIAE
ncbi:MAG: DNA-binding protein [Elusimicrobia bacterium]|nr:DNA-binding protein [Elusimicrobiota bacterium]